MSGVGQMKAGEWRSETGCHDSESTDLGSVMGVGGASLGFSQSLWLSPPPLICLSSSSLSLSHSFSRTHTYTRMHTDGNIDHNYFYGAELWVVFVF